MPAAVAEAGAAGLASARPVRLTAPRIAARREHVHAGADHQRPVDAALDAGELGPGLGAHPGAARPRSRRAGRSARSRRSGGCRPGRARRAGRRGGDVEAGERRARGERPRPGRPRCRRSRAARRTAEPRAAGDRCPRPPAAAPPRRRRARPRRRSRARRRAAVARTASIARCYVCGCRTGADAASHAASFERERTATPFRRRRRPPTPARSRCCGVIFTRRGRRLRGARGAGRRVAARASPWSARSPTSAPATGPKSAATGRPTPATAASCGPSGRCRSTPPTARAGSPT